MADGPAARFTKLATDLAARDHPDTDPDDLPIVVLWGARGSESSELLTHLRRLRDWPAPRAHLDGEDLPDLRPHAVANHLAFQLAQHVDRFGRARFPRFFLGMQAVREPLDPKSAPDARAARRALIDRYLRNRQEGRAWLRTSASAIAVLAGLPPDRAEAFGMAVDGVLEAGRTLALLRGAGLRWYEEGLGHPVSDGGDALVELSVNEFQGAHEFVDEVLCRAFVADLRSEFASGAGPIFERRRNALVLLDNVSTRPTSRFVSMLAAHPDGSGPLLVVAASHQRFPDAAAKGPVVWQPDALAAASREGWLRHRPARNGSRYYPVWVDPIDDVPATTGPREPEVLAFAHERGLLREHYPAVAFARRLTAAHPAGMDMIFRALEGVTPEAADIARFDLRGLFSVADGDGKALDDAVFDLVLGPRTDDLRWALVLMSLCVDLSDAGIGPILVSTADQEIGRQITEFRERDLWVSHQVVDGRPDAPRLHPFARRAIAHRLGREDGFAGLRWDEAHELLRNAAATRGDERAVLYHDLALGRVGPVAARLTELFDPDDPAAWYDLLLQVTKAPLSRPARGRDVNTHYGLLCASAGPEVTVTAQLVAALQLHSDPLGDPHHTMCGNVVHKLGELARATITGAAFLLDRSRDFDCRTLWHPR